MPSPRPPYRVREALHQPGRRACGHDHVRLQKQIQLGLREDALAQTDQLERADLGQHSRAKGERGVRVHDKSSIGGDAYA